MNAFRCSVLALSLCLAGCLAHQIRADVARQIQIFGIELNSSRDYREFRGIVATEEPCLKGYELNFEKLDLIIGYGFNRKIRKITTLNQNTSVFGISPGNTLEEGRKRAIQAGLSEEVAKNRYIGDGISLNLLVDEKGKIFGITVETID
jgi:hypothetical protein